MEKREMNIEEAFDALENLVEKMESGEASLEETFLMYQKGMELLKECSSKIDMVEKKMMLLNENGELHEF